MKWTAIAGVIFLCMPVAGLTQVYTSRDFADSTLEQRYWDLAGQLRCLVCQNQTLADSNAALASDLRRALFEQLHLGKSDDQIRTFLVERYGNYVLYDPPLGTSTLLLWLGPLMMILIAALASYAVLLRYTKGQ